MLKMEEVAKGIAVLGLISLLSYTGGQASAPYMVDEFAEMKNELWRYKEALAGVVKKVVQLDSKVSNVENRLVKVEEKVASIEGKVKEEVGTCVVTSYWLRVRNCPSLKCGTIGLLRRGTMVSYVSTVDGWRKVFGPLGGYLSAKYCK